MKRKMVATSREGVESVKVSGGDMLVAKVPHLANSSDKERGIAFRTRSSKRKRKCCVAPEKVKCASGSKEEVKEKEGSVKKRKLDADDEVCCGICLDKIKERGILNCCDHKFCYSCVKNWLKRSSSCPHCKRQVSNVSRRLKRNKLLVEKVERRLLRDTLEREEGRTVGRVLLVGQLSVHTNRVASPAIPSQAAPVYDNSNFVNVLLGFRNGRSPNPNLNHSHNVNLGSRAAYIRRRSHILVPNSTTSTSDNVFVRNVPAFSLAPSVPQPSRLHHRYAAASSSSMSGTQPPVAGVGQNYLQHCHFHVGNTLGGAVRSDYPSSYLPRNDPTQALSYLPYAQSSSTTFNGATPMPLNNMSWPVQYTPTATSRLVEAHTGAVCLPFTRTVVGVEPTGRYTFPVQSLSSLGLPY